MKKHMSAHVHIACTNSCIITVKCCNKVKPAALLDACCSHPPILIMDSAKQKQFVTKKEKKINCCNIPAANVLKL